MIMDVLLRKVRGYLATWPTSIPGVVAIVHSVSGMLMCLFDPNCGMEALAQEWEVLVELFVGIGLLEARSVHARSEDVNGLLLPLVGALVLLGGSAGTGVAGDQQNVDRTSTALVLPSIPVVEEANWLERGGIWAFAWYDVGESTSGTGLRLTYDLSDQLRFRLDYAVEEFDFNAGTFSDEGAPSLSMRYDLIEGNNIYPYLIAGGGSSSLDSFEWEYLIGAGVDYQFENGITVFAEFLHIRDEDAGFEDRNEIRAGLGMDFDALSGLAGRFSFLDGLSGLLGGEVEK